MKRMQRGLIVLRIGITAAVLSAVAFSFGTAIAQEWASGGGHYSFQFSRVRMRNTSAAAVALNPSWATNASNSGYVDSTVFRRGGVTPTAYDTSTAFTAADYPIPPGVGTSSGTVDTSGVPWIVVRVRQDTLAFGFTGVSGSAISDSIRVGIEYSADGILWFPAQGTPTYRFDTVYFTSSGSGGGQMVSLIGTEPAAGAEQWTVPLRCHPGVGPNEPFNVGRSMCMCGEFMRIIISGRITGQYALEVGSWKRD